MKATVKGDRLTRRIRALELEAVTFEEQRILGLLAHAITVGDSLFEITCEGEETVSFKMVEDARGETEG